MAVSGVYYDGNSARSVPVRLEIDINGLVRAEPAFFEPVPIARVQIASRIGSMPRAIKLPSGARIETDDHDALDEWRRRFGLGHDPSHLLESRWTMALAALAAVALILVGGAVWGVPWVSQRVAEVLPERVVTQLGESTLGALDKSVLRPSALDTDRQRQLAALFSSVLPEPDAQSGYQLLHRDGGWLGANAFALPHRVIVLTDQLVELAESDHEIAAVLLHEVGHVMHRHGIRQVISHAGLAALATAIFGDVSAAGTLVLALPNVLLESSYSRAMEHEADAYALARMDALGIPRDSFAAILARLDAGAVDEDTQSPGLGRYLSSHPPTPDRARQFRGRD
jgi:hypothetical protein